MSKKSKQNVSSIWGGVFEKAPDEIMQEINASIDFDKKLYREDIAGSRAHAEMLAKVGIITNSESKQIIEGLTQIQDEIETGEFVFSKEYEDIHMNIEMRLKDLIGDIAGKLHTARSRNDQVATDFKLFINNASSAINNEITELLKALISKAEDYVEYILPGHTHLQPAQPISFAHQLLAYCQMLLRDKSRFEDLIKRHNQCPLGSAALAGTPYNIDRQYTAEALGFAGPTENSLDSVSSRDFALEFLSNCAIMQSNLTRLAEEIVVFMNPNFGYISLSDSYITGSSIMPQKKNPDAAELVRGKSGRIYGNLVSLLTVMKSLPLAYSKDMQEDKEPAFDSFENVVICLKITTGMIADMKANKERMFAATEKGFLNATDFADWLVTNLSIPFREAHHITGSVVAYAMKNDKTLSDLTLSEMQALAPGVTEDIFEAIKIENSVNSRTSYGGTAFSEVRRAITQIKSEVS
ncbi:MAG: argininosuccinate lyase [Rickettsiales bacterium]|jgi:argininosuccinate lyase|nr:argininosuccinate lyase [Rickettsiales bacterium]